MKALLMAAGRGTRISRYLNGNPKCTIDIGEGMPLIKYTVDMLHRKGINDIAIVTGYRHEVIEEVLKDEQIKFYHNPFFDVTNSIASAWFAKDFIDDDILMMDADVFCEEHLWDKMLAAQDEVSVFYDTSKRENADYKYCCKDGLVIKCGKELSLEETTGESVGIAKVRKNFVPRYLMQLDKMIQNQNHNTWWDEAIYALSSVVDIHAIDLAGGFWAEVDYIEDYERIREFFQSRYEYC